MQCKSCPLNLTLTTMSNYLNKAVSRAEKNPLSKTGFCKMSVHLLFIGLKKSDLEFDYEIIL